MTRSPEPQGWKEIAAFMAAAGGAVARFCIGERPRPPRAWEAQYPAKWPEAGERGPGPTPPP